MWVANKRARHVSTNGTCMNFFKKLFKKAEEPNLVISDDTFGELKLIDLTPRGKFWEVIHNGIRLLIQHDEIKKAPTEELLSLVHKAFKDRWLEESLQSAIGIALEQNPIEYHEKINQFTITSLSFCEDGRVFIGLCDESLWFAESIAGEVQHVWLDV
jgi:thymidine kinase